MLASKPGRVDLPIQRIEYLRKHVRLHDVMTHFGHRYRTNGNMLCCWHSESRPSARLYDDQDTYWCWVCSPNKGVDIIEFVIIELGLEADVDPKSQMPEKTRRALATLRAILYLEDAFDKGYMAEPWEQRLQDSLMRRIPQENPSRYFLQQHMHVLRQLNQSTSPDRWSVYSRGMFQLTPLFHRPVREQVPLWTRLRQTLCDLK